MGKVLCIDGELETEVAIRAARHTVLIQPGIHL